MTHELGPASRALIEAAREGGPDAAAIRRMRAKIEAAIAGGAAGVGAAAGAGEASAAAGGAGTAVGAGAGAGALAVKLGAAAVIAALAVGAILYARSGEEAIAPRIELGAAASRVEAETKVTSREAAAPAHPEAEIEMAPMVVDPARGRGAAAPPSAPAAAPSSEPAPAAPAAPARAAPKRADLAREVELVDRAMAALRRGEPSAALAAVRTHVAETAGAGQLAEDAAAIEIEALCRLHDPNVAAKLAAFDARWPESAQRSRLSTRCP